MGSFGSDLCYAITTDYIFLSVRGYKEDMFNNRNAIL
jgi:hypothetical protein